MIASHPVQYTAPFFRRFARDPRLDIQIAYCSMQGAERAVDPEFGVQVAWDVPLMEGHPWTRLTNWSFRPGTGRFWGLCNPGVWSLIRHGNFDAVILYTGYMYATFWIAVAAAKCKHAAVLFGTDAHELVSRDGKWWKLRVKKWLWPRLFRLADVTTVVSAGGVRLARSLGVPEERIVLTPYTVDNDWWLTEADKVDRAETRSPWGIPAGSPVALFCAKLQPWKRPQDALEAFAQAAVPEAYLVYAGEGPMHAELESRARALGIGGRVRFLGFVNQSELPAVYRSSDVLILPSEYEPFGVVVNEAMLCGCPAIVSDHVGAHFDLVRAGETGFVFTAGDVGGLAKLLREFFCDPERRILMGEAAKTRMADWSQGHSLEATVRAVERAVHLRSRGRSESKP